jgi:predicted secreted Zn-dependent protease
MVALIAPATFALDARCDEDSDRVELCVFDTETGECMRVYTLPHLGARQLAALLLAAAGAA